MQHCVCLHVFCTRSILYVFTCCRGRPRERVNCSIFEWEDRQIHLYTCIINSCASMQRVNLWRKSWIRPVVGRRQVDFGRYPDRKISRDVSPSYVRSSPTDDRTRDPRGSLITVGSRNILLGRLLLFLCGFLTFWGISYVFN